MHVTRGRAQPDEKPCLARVTLKKCGSELKRGEPVRIELSALLVDRAFAWSRENGQYSRGFGSPGEWRSLAHRVEWGFLAPGSASFSLSQSGPAFLVKCGRRGPIAASNSSIDSISFFIPAMSGVSLKRVFG